MQEKNERRTNSARTEEMKARLIAAARSLFVQKGFADTSTPDIVKAAKVTRGALYHHFADKTDLFRAVVTQEAQAVAKQIRKAAAGEDGFEAGARGFFAAMAVPGRVRLLLRDGPAVLGLTEMSEIDAAAGGSTLADAIDAARPDLPQTVRSHLAALFSAAFDRAALSVAEGADTETWLAALAVLAEGTLQER